ncbi:MAG: hypothetical protein C0618_11425 [Desulfuromonas sp.]|nr:MAG: hypothetical protein C0618_11425 [Desulfuromonas sp.]
MNVSQTSKSTRIVLDATLRLLLFGIRITPKPLTGALCALLYRISSLFNRKDRSKIARNIDRILDIPVDSDASRNFQKRVLKHQIDSSVESFKSGFNHQLIHIDGFEEFQGKVKNNLADGRGLIVITGHLGSWELAAYFSALASGERFNALAKPSKLDVATRLLDEYRQRMNTKTLWTHQRSLLKTMVKTLNNGEALGFVMDQRPDGRKGPTAQFMGQPTTFAVGPAWTAARCNSPIMGLFCIRQGPWRYRLISTDLLPANHGETDTEAMTQLMASEIERVIRLYPHQWVWNYNRWNF